MSTTLPPCGIYRTTGAIGSIPAGRLVYFHNHGNPGPGVYLPGSWQLNRAQFEEHGTTLAEPESAAFLEPLLAEGLYRVTESFTCCEKACRTFGRELLVQLGYDREAHAILFVPEWTPAGLAFPEMGQAVDDERLRQLSRLEVPDSPAPEGGLPA